MFAELKPYPEYKPSHEWIGPAPSHWEVVPGFAAFREHQVKNTGMAVTDVLSLSYGRIVVKPPDKLHGLVPASFETYQIVEPGDIIIRPTDLQNDWHSIRVGLAKNRGIITSAYMCLKPTTLYSPEYLHALLLSYDMLKFFYGMGSGLRQSLDYKDLKRFPMLVPPSAEQAGIVRFLGAVDRKVNRFIRAKRRLIEVLTEQKQGIITHAVTKGLHPSAPGTRFKPTGKVWVPEVPAGWSAVTLRRVITRAVDGPHHSPTYVDQGVMFISARNVKVDEWSLADAKYISQADYEEFSRRIKPEVGDVLYTKGGTTGVARAVDLDFPFQVWVHIAVLKLRRSVITPAYLALALNSTPCYRQAQLYTRGATNQDLGLGRMKDIELPLPPTLTEQESIVEYVSKATDAIRRAIADARGEIDLIREYRTRLVADVVTGKVDVRAAAAAIPDEAQGPGTDQGAGGAHESSDDSASEDDAADGGGDLEPALEGSASEGEDEA